MTPDDTEGCASPEIADTGNALVALFGWAAFVFAAFVLWLIVESVREAPPRPAEPAGRAR